MLFPDGSYVKKGDTIVRREIREDVDGRSYKLRPVARGPDITGDGEVYWASFENEGLRITKSIGELALELLDPDEQYKLFTVVGKAAKEPLAPITEEESVSEHRITGKTIVRGDQVSAGSLHGIDQQMWEKGREYLVFVRYELRPLPEQNGEPGPMLAPEEDGEFVNCFVRYVVSHFQNKMTRAGSRLTPKRRRILERFDKKLADTGCKKEDMLALETALKVKLVAVDALGNTLWDSSLYKTSTKVVIPCHNSHAWADIPTDPPKVERVHFLDEPAERALLAVVTSYGHEAKTTATQKTLDKKIREILVAFAARAIPSTTRLWLCGQSLVGSDGFLWSSRSAARAIDKAFEAETCASLQDDLPKELEEEYHKATHSMGGATAYRFGKWLSTEDIRPTPEKFRPAWKAAQVEAKVWNSEDSPVGGVGDAIDLVREYGFPTSIMRRGNCEGVPLCDVLRLTGAIQLSAWEFAPNTHPYTVGRVGEHLRENEGWITTPELRDLLDSGDLVAATALEVIYSVGVKPCIRLPARDLAVVFVGKCTRHGEESSILVRDPNEAAFLCNTLGGTDRLLNFEKADNVTISSTGMGRPGPSGSIFGHSYSPTPMWRSEGCSGGSPRKRSSESALTPSMPRLSLMRSQTCLLRTTPSMGSGGTNGRATNGGPKQRPGKSNAGASTHWRQVRLRCSPRTLRQRLRGGCTWQAKAEAVRPSGR